MEHTAENTYVNWRTIFVGLFATFIINLCLISLGAALGAVSSVRMFTNGDVAGALGMTIFWLVVATLLSFFAGSFFAIRFTAITSALSASLHGFLIAALYFAVTFFIFTPSLEIVALDFRSSFLFGDDFSDSALAKAISLLSWTLFATLFLSMGAAILGSLFGVRGNIKHPLEREHLRHLVPVTGPTS